MIEDGESEVDRTSVVITARPRGRRQEWLPDVLISLLEFGVIVVVAYYMTVMTSGSVRALLMLLGPFVLIGAAILIGGRILIRLAKEK
jgi:hypothetical protein